MKVPWSTSHLAFDFTSCYLLAVLFIGIPADEAEFDGTVTLQLQHTFDLGANAEFVLRRTITVRSLKSAMTQLPSGPEGGLTEEQRTKLSGSIIDFFANYLLVKQLSKTSGFYRLRAPVKSSPSGRISYLSTFVEACALYESGLSDILTIHTDASGQPVSISVTTTKPLCDGFVSNPLSDFSRFNTTVDVQSIENGPSPDTSAYIQKVDREKAEKAKGEQGDNRSFFAKYWMYIVPVFIFIFISGIANPENSGGR